MEIKPIEPIVKTQISNQKWKSVKVENNPIHKSLGKTFEDYLNECMKSDDKIIKVDEFKKLEESIPYINIKNKDDVDYYINVAMVKMAYGY